jgi:nitroreductase
MVKKLIEQNRSCRRYDPSRALSKEEFRELVELARLSPCAANRQTLRYALADGQRADIVFDSIMWAGYLEDGAPKEGERPASYILLLHDKNLGAADLVSVGIAIQSMLLGAVEMGYKGCIFGSIDRKRLKTALGLAENLEIVNVIAIGKPAENIVIEDIRLGDSIKYYRTADRTHHVPKIVTSDLIVEL